MVIRWWHGWTPLVVVPFVVLVFTLPQWPPWAAMWTLALSIYLGCKWLTWRRTPMPAAPACAHAGYLLAWPGLDAEAFLSPREPSLEPSPREWISASIKTALGIVVVFGGVRSIPARDLYIVGWVGMIGLVLTLHFGMFHLLSCVWRSAGVNARPLMKRPLMSTSVGEFWGRWNTAFRDLTHRFLFRPLAPRFGARGAILVGFLFSGLVHELVISVPARGGYGGPTLFFGLQGAAIFFERSPIGRRIGLGEGWKGRLFTMLVLVAPVPWLFHGPFVETIIVPFLRAIGAL